MHNILITVHTSAEQRPAVQLDVTLAQNAVEPQVVVILICGMSVSVDII